MRVSFSILFRPFLAGITPRRNHRSRHFIRHRCRLCAGLARQRKPPGKSPQGRFDAL